MTKINLLLSLQFIPETGWMYEHATAINWIAELRPGWEEEGQMPGAIEGTIRRLHEQCAKGVGTRPDNKQTFKCRIMGSDTVLYFTFHDNNLYIGTDVAPYRGDKLCEPDYPKPKKAQ